MVASSRPNQKFYAYTVVEHVVDFKDQLPSILSTASYGGVLDDMTQSS